MSLSPEERSLRGRLAAQVRWSKEDPRPGALRAHAGLERKFLGVVEVDSGTLLVGDPTYCLPHAQTGRAGIDYEVVIKAPSPSGYYLLKSGAVPVQILP